ncbi:MAG: hypothetical protein II912_10735 [Clostridia bacterium]|nr:hypothetical protein [Clostridia bacterium]
MKLTNATPIETERKFLIRKPDGAFLAALEGCTVSDITQTYLLNEDGNTERVRRRVYADRTVYTHTVKKRISPMSALEQEREISPDEYALLLTRADPARRPIIKTRYAVPHAGHTAEIDVYPFWNRQAVLEIELQSENDGVPLPDFMTVIREVTGDHSYSNNSLSLKVPEED